MARKISNYTGTVIAPGGDYPYGRIKNAPSGTKVNEQMLGDVVQLMMRMLDSAGITANELPDNTTNTFQLFLALQTVIENKIIGTKRSFSAGAGQGGYLAYYTSAGSLPIVTLASTKQELTLGGANFYEFNLGTSPSHDVVTFGTGINPGYVAMFYWQAGSGSFGITLNSTNTSGQPMITQAGVTASNTAFIPIVGKAYLVVRRTSVWEIVEYPMWMETGLVSGDFSGGPGGSITVATGDIAYAKWRIDKKTVQVQIKLRTVTVTSSPAYLNIQLPFLPSNFANDGGMSAGGVYIIPAAAGYELLPVAKIVASPNLLRVYPATNFVAGTDDSGFDVDVTFEIV